MAVTAQQIQMAIKAGYSPDEIVSHLSATEPSMKTAVNAGYSADEIVSHFAPSRKVETQGNPDASPAETERMKQEFMQKSGGTVERIKQNAESWVKAAVPYVRPVVEGIGAAGGGVLGASLGTMAGGVGAVPGGVGGAALGYAAGKNIMDTVSGDWAATPTEAAGRTLKDLGTGAMYEMGGQVAGPTLKTLSSGAGKVIKPVLGRLSGTGQGAVDEAIKSGIKSATVINPLKSATAFDKALRGKITGEEIVDNAKTALGRIKESRTAAYQTQLQQVAQNQAPIDLRPIKNEVQALMQKYNVKVDPATGAIDTSRIAMGKTGRNDIEDIIEEVSSWGTKNGDNTALGLDTLKRRLDDFYSDSSQARQFVTQIRNKVKDTIVTNVPAYDDMTKGYTEATKLIKDIESGLMMRKQGISGRIVADQTLRRLMSSMRDNFALRKELVDVLGNKGGADLSGQIAGYTQNSILPTGLSGSGPALAGGAAYAQFVNPSFWPVLAASSPRVQGEFLRMFGKAAGIAGKIPKKAVSGAVRQTLITNRAGQDNDD